MSGIRNNHTAQIGINVKDEGGNVHNVTLQPGMEIDLTEHGLTVIETPMYKGRIKDKLLTTDVSGEDEDQQELQSTPGGQEGTGGQTEPSGQAPNQPNKPASQPASQPASKPAAKPEAK